MGGVNINEKAADYIAVSAFFVIVIMFAAYTLMMGRHGSESEKADSSDIRHNVQTYVSSNFPLSSNWKSLRTTMFVMTGKKILIISISLKIVL